MDIAVCDDNKTILRELESQLLTLSMADNISVFSDLDAFWLSVDGGKRYDAVLMDIDWDEKAAGMDTAAELYKLCPETKIIYVTGHVEKFNQKVFLQRANMSGFLTKPVDIELLRANLQKAADDLTYQEQPALALQKQGATISVPLREIYFIESRRHTVNVHTAAEVITTYERLENIIRNMPSNFYQCHKSFIVNMNHISRIQSGEIYLKNGGRVPISRARHNETKEAYHNYIGRKL